MLQLTAQAIAKIKEISEAEGIGHCNIRVKVQGGGCAGLTNDLFFEELPPTDLDEILSIDGVTVMIDGLSSQYLEGTEIDYITKDFSAGFVFRNPNTNSCACGNSYGMK